ncbi:MAG TPA: hypothetical protein VNY07_04135 [Chthoniobacterales bacterium]|nr:hypothetical protein [Chthoniobacterales bacterium]
MNLGPVFLRSHRTVIRVYDEASNVQLQFARDDLYIFCFLLP